MRVFEKKTLLLCIAVLAMQVVALPVSGQEAAPPAPEGPKLVRAVMGESIDKFSPVNQAVVFSIDIGRIVCFTEFDPVPEKSVIHHKWYRKDHLITVKKLTVTPPRWASVSSMQFRDADKGPWRVDITDAGDKLLQSLRFSITD